ncbi:hypothetical protein TRAPUB_12321 [Trametes pubescens]|uniref:Uncharacterized protein n=1 Tax=Trametes pubescens TaxID=154538 RepID=A0A1M2VU93_TRAPU|nr:hypothetical protein TRAPUB_12321 [Trametes pubescens]
MKVLNVSSALGSIASAEAFGKGTITSYSISKAALNMFTYKLKQERPDLIVGPYMLSSHRTSMFAPDTHEQSAQLRDGANGTRMDMNGMLEQAVQPRRRLPKSSTPRCMAAPRSL